MQHLTQVIAIQNLIVPPLARLPPQLLLYLATAPEEKVCVPIERVAHPHICLLSLFPFHTCGAPIVSQIKYTEGGDRAVTRFEEGAQGYETRAFRGMGVVTSMPYEVSDDQDSVQMLQRSSQVGEFYRMSPPPVPKFDNNNQLPQEYMVCVPCPLPESLQRDSHSPN